MIKDLYASAGYDFSSVNAKVREVESDNLDLVIEVDEKTNKNISIKFVEIIQISVRILLQVRKINLENNFEKCKFSENLINLDKRLLSNYCKSLSFMIEIKSIWHKLIKYESS